MRAYRSTSYSRDPYWFTTEYGGYICNGCKLPILRGTEVFFYPNNRKCYCDSESCGQKCARDFAAARFDERGY